ncbi:hypothetical protein AgCh_012235 [Apium graveolens]
MADSLTEQMCREATGRLSFAKMLIEVDARNQLPDNLFVHIMRDDGGDSVEVSLKVEYPWRPSWCTKCVKFGHSVHDCPILAGIKEQDNTRGKSGVSGENLAHGQGDGFTVVHRPGKEKLVEFREDEYIDQEIPSDKSVSAPVTILAGSLGGSQVNLDKMMVDKTTGKKDYYSEPDASDLFMMQGIVRGREDDFQNGESKDEGDRGDLEPSKCKEVAKLILDNQIGFCALIETHVTKGHVKNVFDSMMTSSSPWIVMGDFNAILSNAEMQRRVDSRSLLLRSLEIV